MAIVTRKQIYNDQNVFIFRPLISEFSQEPERVVFTMNKEHKDGHISLYNLFIKFVVDDPTETTFAEEVFGDVPYWFKIREFSAFAPYLEEWRSICDILRKKKAFEVIIDEVKSKGKNSFQAAKYLIEEPYKKTAKAKTKARQTARIASQSPEIKEDLERIRNVN